ncbi:hypothetical protein KMB89_gp13 [Citrobacter phage HCF1]|uniref:Uncharacterized protein n=1 Tax=Citrobacter phage HCF1 TaxID=2849700 RepID=A0ABX6D3J7_9CAUD|nr:hypothetical protein KMB89_gp13 [Citrobacter phage HCF1]
MMLDNKAETEKTITYMRTIANMLESGEYYLSDLSIRCENINWNIERKKSTFNY